MTDFQPHLGDSKRPQELRSSPFWLTPLFWSHLVKDGEEFILKKGPPKTLRILDPIKTSLLVVSTTIKRGSCRKHPNEGQSTPSSSQSFSSGRGKSSNRGSEGCLRPHPRGRGHGNLSSQRLLKSLPQSTSKRLPPFFQKRLANRKMLKQCVKHYYQWLRSTIHHKTKISHSLPDSHRIQCLSK